MTARRVSASSSKISLVILARLRPTCPNDPPHVEDTKMKRPEFPMFFNKQSSCVPGPGDPIHLPRASSALDYEGELGFVIGRRCRHVPRDRAHQGIAGSVFVNERS